MKNSKRRVFQPISNMEAVACPSGILRTTIGMQHSTGPSADAAPQGKMEVGIRDPGQSICGRDTQPSGDPDAEGLCADLNQEKAADGVVYTSFLVIPGILKYSYSLVF